MKYVSLGLILFLVINMAKAQDLIYSQFNAMPLMVNPAFAGNNSCNYRVSAIGRSQWMGVENAKTYQSATIGGDFNLNNIYDEKYNLWGLGMVASYDKSGQGSFQNLALLANVAYHARFGEDGKNFLSFGIQGGLGQTGVNTEKFVFADELDPYGRRYPNKSTAETFNSTSIWYPEMGLGALLTLNPKENMNLYGGLSAFHLLNPNLSFTNEEFRLPMRVNFHAGGNLYKAGWFYLPSIYVQYQQNVNYNVGLYVGKILAAGDESKNPLIGYLGLWYKSSDAITPALRFDIGRMTIAFSYDIHVGGVSQNLSGVGSPELSLNLYGCFGRSSKRTGCPSL